MTGMLRAIFALVCMAMVVSASAGTDAAQEKSPAIARVITMLENLVNTLDEEAAKDEEVFTHFSGWCAGEIETSGVSIERLQADIEETTAALGHLNAKKGQLDMEIAELKQNINVETTQLNAAREKRAEENTAFVNEQQQFDGAISACAQAAKLLAAHYGEGEAEPAQKPAFMSLVAEQVALVRRAAAPLKKHTKVAKLVGLLQTGADASVKVHTVAHLRRAGGASRIPSSDRYQSASSEAGNIVDQINEISETFSEDKQSSINDENKLQQLFNDLSAEKTTLINQLTGEFNTKDGLLTETNQEIASKEGHLQRCERELTETQAYLARTTQMRNDATEAYNTRQADRAAEKEAVNQALGVLRSYTPSLMQRRALLQHGQAHKQPAAGLWGAPAASGPIISALAMNLAGSRQPCAQCTAAASLLRSRAMTTGSELLQAAASATAGAGNEAIADIISRLGTMITQIGEQQHSEDEHKEWCETELGLTNQKVTDHSSVIDHLTAELANMKEVLVEDTNLREQTREEIQSEEAAFEEAEKLRGEGKNEFEHAHQETQEAIDALNQAIGILAKFYASRNAGAAFIQAKGHAMQPSVNDGGGVVDMISHTRGEFETAKTNLETEETNAVHEFEEVREAYVEVDGNLHTDENMETVEIQNDDRTIDTTEDDLQQENVDKASAKSYLDQLGRSCYMLLNNYEDRKKKRSEEETAINDAITVLREHA